MSIFSKFFSLVFAFSCLSFSAVSNNMLGPGIWFFVFIISGIFVGASQFFRPLQSIGINTASLMAMFAFLAIILLLVASTIGTGTAKLDGNGGLLIFLLLMICFSGLLLKFFSKKN